MTIKSKAQRSTPKYGQIGIQSRICRWHKHTAIAAFYLHDEDKKPPAGMNRFAG